MCLFLSMLILQLAPNILSPEFHAQRPLHLRQNLLIGNRLAILIIVDNTGFFIDLLSEIRLFPGRCFLGSGLGDGFTHRQVDFGGWCNFVFTVDFS